MNNKRRGGFSLIEGVIFVLIVVILAGMAVPAFNQVKTQEQKRKVLVNLQHIATVGQEYINAEKVDKVMYADLVAKKYLDTVTPINGEDYNQLTVYKNKGALEVDFGKHRVTYQYGE
jgi:type II secretory pathway pseudopilin PulG